MARISRQTREIIKIVIALVVVALVVIFYIIYPLNKVKGLWGRSGEPAAEAAANDPSAFLESGLVADTFRIEVDAMTKLACVYAGPPASESTQIKGTVILLHGNQGDRESLAPLAKTLIDSGYAVTAYDQRASGRSTGAYHGDGQLEASDLAAVLAYLDIRGKVIHPLTLVGYETGADAAIWASREESRIDRVVAVGPYLTTDAVAGARLSKEGSLWFPFRSSVFWWWYKIRSSYATPYLGIDSVKAAAVPTVVLMPADRLQSAEVVRFDQLSPDTLVTVEALAGDSAAAEVQVIGAVMRR